MKSQVLHTVWAYISVEAAGEIWHWSLLGVKGLKWVAFAQNLPSSTCFLPGHALWLVCSRNRAVCWSKGREKEFRYSWISLIGLWRTGPRTQNLGPPQMLRAYILETANSNVAATMCLRVAGPLYRLRLRPQGTLQQFVDRLFATVFIRRGTPIPIAIKFLFDLLDEQARELNLTDPEVLHTWKNNRSAVYCTTFGLVKRLETEAVRACGFYRVLFSVSGKFHAASMCWKDPVNAARDYYVALTLSLPRVITIKFLLQPH